MKNLEKAVLILEQLADQGVGTLCLCPGGRNAAFVSLLSKSRGFEIISFYDERSAGFFALGRSRRDQKPVAVLTTSGTAVSELLSPVIEAYHSDVAVVVVSSDRPRRLRGTGAPQTIEQSRIFKGYVEKSWDIENCKDFKFQASFKKPLHVNVCFDEPLLDGDIPSKVFYPKRTLLYGGSEKNRKKSRSFGLSSQIQSFKKFTENSNKNLNRCLVVVGALRENQRQAVTSSLLKQEVPIFLESLSGLKCQESLMEKRIFCGEKTVSKMIRSGEIRSVLRLGDVPLGRYWRDLDQMKIPILSISDKNFSGTDKSEMFTHSLLEDPLTFIDLPPWDWSEWKKTDRKLFEKVKTKAEKFSFSEVGLVFELTKQIPRDHSIYLGNSLPIRLWDLMNQKHFRIFASRGVNGIDGQVSTAFGLHDFKKPLWIILGDLTTLYDFSGFWLTPYLIENKAQVNLVVINNHGGQIFSRLFHDPLFCNHHELGFEKLAQFWNWSYQKFEKNLRLKKSPLKFQHLQNREWIENPGGMETSQKDILNFCELCVDKKANENFWREYDKL